MLRTLISSAAAGTLSCVIKPSPRAGYTAFKDGVSYGAAEYRDGLQFIYNKVCFEDPALQTDDRRVEVIISYV